VVNHQKKLSGNAHLSSDVEPTLPNSALTDRPKLVIALPPTHFNRFGNVSVTLDFPITSDAIDVNSKVLS
jgi:hypothetical protein